MSWLQSLTDTLDFLSRAIAVDKAISSGALSAEQQAAAVRALLTAPKPAPETTGIDPVPSAAPAW